MLLAHLELEFRKQLAEKDAEILRLKSEFADDCAKYQLKVQNDCVKEFAKTVGVNMPLNPLPFADFIQLVDNRLKRLRGENRTTFFEEKMSLLSVGQPSSVKESSIASSMTFGDKETGRVLFEKRQ